MHERIVRDYETLKMDLNEIVKHSTYVNTVILDTLEYLKALDSIVDHIISFHICSACPATNECVERELRIHDPARCKERVMKKMMEKVYEEY